jgi:hypothetical protein
MSPDPACLTKANHLRGLGFGLVAAFLCALVWGQVELDSAAIFLPFAIVQGFVLAKAVHLGTGVMTKWSQALVFALMLLSVLTGDVIATARRLAFFVPAHVFLPVRNVHLHPKGPRVGCRWWSYPLTTREAER